MNKQQNRNDAIKKVAIILSVLALFVGSCGQATTKQKQTETTNENVPVFQKDSLVRENMLVKEDIPIQEKVFTPEDSLRIQEHSLWVQVEQFHSTNIFEPQPQDLKLYEFWDLEFKEIGFISLGSPDLNDMEKENMEYFKLSSKYRKRFLSKIKISETDTVFVYNYSTDILLSFPVKNLNVAVIYFDKYRSFDECRQCNQDDYMIGFEINKNLLNGLSGGLVYIGKENPFVQGQMKLIIWKKINSNEFPSAKADFQTTNVMKGNAYLYESNDFQYFIQDLGCTNTRTSWARHLLVIDKKNDKRVIEEVFISGEGGMIAPLNFGIDGNEEYVNIQEQWTGKLFKNKPTVVFGFEWVFYSCPCFTLLDSTTGGYICISCDNRD